MKKLKVGIVSPFQVQCGNALHTESFAMYLTEMCKLKVFAEYIIPPQTELPPLNEKLKVDYERCWLRTRGFEHLQEEILKFSPDIIHIQFVGGLFIVDANPRFYKLDSNFQEFVKNLRDAGIKIVVTLHDIPAEGRFYTGDITNWYIHLHAKFIVNPCMLPGLLRYYPEADVTVIHGGTPNAIPYEKSEARKILGLKDEFILTQIGFYGANKGMRELIDSIPKISIPKFKLVFAGGFHPHASKDDRVYIKECLSSAIKLGIADKITFLAKYLSEDELNLWCSASDFFVLNQTLLYGYSGSTTGYRVLLYGKPILMSKSLKLATYKDGVHCLKFAENEMPNQLMKLYNDKELQQKLSRGALAYAKETSCKAVAKKYFEVYQSCLKD